MPERKQKAEVAEADALESGVGSAAGARSDQASSPPRFEHGIPAEAAAAGACRKTAKKIRQRAPDEEEHGHPERDEAAHGEQCEKKIFDDTVAQNIELRAKRSGEAARAGEIAVEGVKGDSGDGVGHGGAIGGKIGAEESEERDGGERSHDARESDLIGRHANLPAGDSDQQPAREVWQRQSQSADFVRCWLFSGLRG